MRALAQSLRSLLRRPGYTAAAVLTLALGIGASTSMYALIEGSLLRPLPYPESDRLVRFRDLYKPTGGSGGVTTPNFLDLEREARTLSLAAYGSQSFNLAAEGRAERASGLAVTHDFFDVLGVPPVRGRGFRAGEDRAGRAPVVVVSHRLWRERFGGAPGALGQALLLDGEPHTVVGVLPERFWFPGEPEVIVPFAWTEQQVTQNRGSRWMEGIGRLAAGVSVEAADAELKRVFAGLEETYPESNEGWSVRVWDFREWAVGGNAASLKLLAGAVLLVLLIGCANVANLMLVRAERRTREMAVRAALGAGRARITRQFLGEGVVLAALGGLAGLGVAWAAMRVLLALYGDSLPRADQVALTPGVLAFAVGLALLTGLLVGVAPALRLDLRGIYATLREGDRGGAAGGSRLQKALVAAEVAVAVLLVSGAGLMLNSFWHLNRVDSGVRLENALTFTLQMNDQQWDSAEPIHQFFDRAVARIAAIPGVEHVGISERTPLQGGYNITTLASPDDPERTASFVEIRRVTPGYFPAVGIPLRQGRMLTEADGAAASDVVVISDELARTLFPAGDAVGKRILSDWNEGIGYEVVGVVGSVREFGLRGAQRPAVYWPWGARGASTTMTFVVRTAGQEPATLIPAVRTAVAELDPTVPVFAARTMKEVAIQTVGPIWFATALFTAFGAIALALAALGMFGVLAYVVEQRTREIGIRMALGSSAGDVLRRVVGQGLRLVAVGLLIGVGGAIFAGRLLADMLYEVEPADPWTLSAVVVTALLTATVACLIPAYRAARVEPVEALRHE